MITNVLILLSTVLSLYAWTTPENLAFSEYALFFIFNIVAIQRGAMGNVAYVAHVIGFVIGLFLGVQWNKKWVKSFLFTLLLLAIYIILYNYLKTLIQS